MRVRTETALTAAGTLSAAAAVISAAASLLTFAVLHPSPGDPEYTAAFITLAAAAVFGVCSAIQFRMLSGYRRITRPETDIECFRLKKAGLPGGSRDSIIPKGKLPKE